MERKAYMELLFTERRSLLVRLQEATTSRATTLGSAIAETIDRLETRIDKQLDLMEATEVGGLVTAGAPKAEDEEPVAALREEYEGEEHG